MKLTVLGDNKLFTDSDEIEYSYSHKKDKLKNPVISGYSWETDSDNEVYNVSWDAVDGADGYVVRVLDNSSAEKFKSEIITAKSYKLSSESFTLGTDYKVGIMAVTTDRLSDSDFSEIIVNTAFAGSYTVGTDDYCVISNERHFKNISQKADGKYILNEDITLTDYTPVAVFSGVLRGYNTTTDSDEMHSINVNISGQGLFATATGTFEISNITLVENFIDITFYDLIEKIDGADTETAGSIAGSRFYYFLSKLFNRIIQSIFSSFVWP